MLVGTATSVTDSVSSFAAGTALWSAALLLTSIPREFAVWTRVVAVIGAVLFAVTSGRIFWGDQIFPTSRPLPFYAYPFLVVTFVGWIFKLLKAS
jgi:predicted lysophospholipase L1 biosynthesis ABC-type transport system permease subunit